MTLKIATLTPFLASPALQLEECSRREPHGVCYDWEEVFLWWRVFSLGSYNNCQSLTIPIPSVGERSPKGFFFLRAVTCAVTGNLVSSKKVESDFLLSLDHPRIALGIYKSK